MTETAHLIQLQQGMLALDATETFIARYVSLTGHQLTAVTLWVAVSHTLDAFEVVPYLQVTSATKQTGKTRLLEVLEGLVARPWMTGRTSAAALVRKMASRPTLLLDETDAAFASDQEYSEALRGVLNSGYKVNGYASLCVGSGGSIEVRDFPTFGLKALAGIGHLPDTVADRSIRIELKRKIRTEPVEKYRLRTARPEAAPIHAKLAAWGARIVPRLGEVYPDVPDALTDRMQDIWEPLVVLADEAGGTWPARVRAAAIALSGSKDEDDISVELLHDIRRIFQDKDLDFIQTANLINLLTSLETRPWGDWRQGRPISGRRVASMLKAFSIVPVMNSQTNTRGYYLDRFVAAWARYLPPPDELETGG